MINLWAKDVNAAVFTSCKLSVILICMTLVATLAADLQVVNDELQLQKPIIQASIEVFYFEKRL